MQGLVLYQPEAADNVRLDYRFWIMCGKKLTEIIESLTNILNLQWQQLVTGQLADAPTRVLPTCGLVVSRTGQVADWTARRLVKSRTRQLVDWSSRG